MTESAYLRRLLPAILAAGWTIKNVNNGEEVIEIIDNNVHKTVVEAKSTDLSHINFFRADSSEKGWLFLVWQDPHDKDPDLAAELVNDMTMNLSDVVDKLNAEIGAC